MSLSSDMRTAGFKALMDAAGEYLLFRDFGFYGVVKRPGEATPVDATQKDFLERNETLVEVLRDYIALPPRSGEYFEDKFGDFHRIKVVSRTDITYQCKCELDMPESDE